MNALLRWETSITDMPLDFQSVISAWACWRTSSGNVAGPAAKLKTRMLYSSSRTLLPDRLLTPDVIARGRGIYQDVGVSTGLSSPLETPGADGPAAGDSSARDSMRSMPVRRSPSPSRMRRTPWVLRPTTEISPTGVRTKVPVELMSI